MDLVRRFTHDWIGIDGLVPICTSAFGDVFLQSADGRVCFLDTMEGA